MVDNLIIRIIHSSSCQNHSLVQRPLQLYTKILVQGHLPSNYLFNLCLVLPLLLILVAEAYHFKISYVILLILHLRTSSWLILLEFFS